MKKSAKTSLLGILMAGALLGGATARAADAGQAAAPAVNAAAVDPAVQAARDAQLATLDGVLSALYGTISGTAGAPRDWDRLRNLFKPDAHMVVHGMNKAGEFTTRVMTVSDYISRAVPLFEKEGFFESELARTADTFGQLAQVFSTYESRHAPGDAKPFARGINSIQLVNDGKRWWIQSLVWQAESDKNPLPERYLKSRPQ